MNRMMKSPLFLSTLLLPALTVNNPFAQSIHALQPPVPKAKVPQCCVQVTFILINDGPKATHITFITVYWCNRSVLLLVIVNFYARNL